MCICMCQCHRAYRTMSDVTLLTVLSICCGGGRSVFSLFFRSMFIAVSLSPVILVVTCCSLVRFMYFQLPKHPVS